MELIEQWLAYWKEELWNRDVRYELVVAHPADYHAIKNLGSYPCWVRFAWTEDVMVGSPAVFEKAKNYRPTPQPIRYIRYREESPPHIYHNSP